MCSRVSDACIGMHVCCCTWQLQKLCVAALSFTENKRVKMYEECPAIVCLARVTFFIFISGTKTSNGIRVAAKKKQWITYKFISVYLEVVHS